LAIWRARGGGDTFAPMPFDRIRSDRTIRRRVRLSRREIVIASLLTFVAGALLLAAMLAPSPSLVGVPSGSTRAAEVRR